MRNSEHFVCPHFYGALAQDSRPLQASRPCRQDTANKRVLLKGSNNGATPTMRALSIKCRAKRAAPQPPPPSSSNPSQSPTLACCHGGGGQLPLRLTLSHPSYLAPGRAVLNRIVVSLLPPRGVTLIRVLLAGCGFQRGEKMFRTIRLSL